MKLIMNPIVIALIIMACPVPGTSGYYTCPYDGPADTPNETQFQVEQYLLDVNIAFPSEEHEGYLQGSCRLQCVILQENLTNLDLDFLFDGMASVDSVTVDGTASAFDFSGDLIQISLPNPGSIDDVFIVDVHYRVEGNDHFKFVPKPPKTVLYAFNSMVEASRWFPCLHDPNDKALYEFRVRTADTLLSACNGTLMSIDDHGDGTHTMTWVEHNPMATYLATINISEYVTFGHDWNSIPVIYYVRPESLSAAQYDFQNDLAILDFFNDAFGPYPFEKMGLAQVRLSGAMENQDMISYGLITGDLTYENTFAHEISHMYWGNSVTLTGCEDVWLNEGFASYCEALWQEHFYGDAEYDVVMADFRDRYFAEDANTRFSIYDPAIVWSNTTYRKGAWVLHMLRRITGDSVFEQILQEYYDRFKFTHATTPEFKSVCEELYNADLSWFFDQWIYQAGYPEFDVSFEYADGNAVVFIEQTQQNAPIFTMPGIVRLEMDDATFTDHPFTLQSGMEAVIIPSLAEPVSVVLDPHDSILCKSRYHATNPDARCIIEMPSQLYEPGDICWCRVHVDQFSCSPLEDYPLFVILDVFGSLFFAPSFTEFDSYRDIIVSFPPGRTSVDVLPAFSWPADAGSVQGIHWYAGLTNPEMTHLHGDFGMFTFGWEE